MGAVAGGPVLVLNAGSSSLKYAVFDAESGGGAEEAAGEEIARGLVEIGPEGAADHAAALDAVLARMADAGLPPARLAAAGHRVVHGGSALTAPTRITPEIIREIRSLCALAPLHNPPALAAIETLAARAPDLPQVAVFDTAFHADMPELARRYALPARAGAEGIRRYGFHGISCAALVEALPGISGAPLPRRLLALHLGAGASATAILDGRSVATTMGYSPLDGLPMASRSGGLDPEAVLVLAERLGTEGARRLLWHESGLRGLAGSGDMRALLGRDDPQARFAIRHFAYWTTRHAGSLIAAMGGLDALAFTGGIGAGAAPVRAAIMEGLGWAGLTADPAANAAHGPALHAPDSRVTAWVVPAREEAYIAARTRTLLAAD